MATKKPTTKSNNVTFTNVTKLADDQLNSTPSASLGRAAKVPQWRALKWALKFASATPTEPPTAPKIELPREYHPPDVSYHQCFKELDNFRHLFSLLASKSEALSCLLESEGEEWQGEGTTVTSKQLDSETKDKECGIDESDEQAVQPESVKPFQEFLDMFVSIFLHSDFLSSGGVSEDINKFHIISTLVSKTCPELSLFRRVCVAPEFIASQMPDSSNDNVYRSIPINQLARFCDVSVLRFLSTATEHTSREAVIWTIEYLRNLLDLLHVSLTKLNLYGWYGAPPLRTRKGTTMGRHSITYPAMASPFVTPPVVVVGTPPASPAHTLSTTASQEPSLRTAQPYLDPETGQRSPLSPLSHGILPPGRRGRGSFPPFVGSEPSLHGAGAGAGVAMGRGRNRRISREDHHVGLVKPPSVEQPQKFHSSHSWEETHATSSSPPSSEPHGDLMVAQAQQVSPSRQSMQSIPEVEDGAIIRISDAHLPTLEEHGRTNPGEGDLYDHVDVPPALTDHAGPPQPSATQLGVIQEDAKDEGRGGLAVNVTLETRSPSPGLSGILSPGSSLSSLAEPEEEEVRSKPVATMMPPGPKDVPKVNVQKELETLMNGEGRISLLAILHSISRLPQTQELWLGDMGEKCFTLIQLCMDLGLRISSGEDTLPKPAAPKTSSSSGKERRKQFQSQKNAAFHEHTIIDIEDKPSKVHSWHVVEFSVRALIHCATSLIVGCTSDHSRCRLRNLHLPDQSISTYNTLTRLLKRVYTFSPRCFHQAMADFAKPSGSSCRQLFQFLHIILQYCTPPMDGHLNIFLMSIVSAVLRETIDRLVQLDITEASIQNVSH